MKSIIKTNIIIEKWYNALYFRPPNINGICILTDQNEKIRIPHYETSWNISYNLHSTDRTTLYAISMHCSFYFSKWKFLNYDGRPIKTGYCIANIRTRWNIRTNIRDRHKLLEELIANGSDPEMVVGGDLYINKNSVSEELYQKIEYTFYDMDIKFKDTILPYGYDRGSIRVGYHGPRSLV